jgi:hypothetical protein
MNLFIDGAETPIPFTFKSLRALALALKAPKIADLEVMLNKIGFDNCAHLAGVMIRTIHKDITDAQIDDAIEDAGFPIRLIEAIGEALSGPKAEKSEATVKAINEGN